MRIVVVVDAFNLYYGARAVCGPSGEGWKWLDVGSLVERKLAAWGCGQITDIIYCTALRGRVGASRSADQDCYLGALQEHDPRVKVVLGKYVSRVKQGVLFDPAVRRPVPWPEAGMPEWLPARQVPGMEGGVEALVQVRVFEEKGSDVNVAASLLTPTLTGGADAAVVVSNDSDLAEPLRQVRRAVPLGVINPSTRQTAADLRGSADEGVGGHWWGRFTREDYAQSQMPKTVGRWTCPEDW